MEPSESPGHSPRGHRVSGTRSKGRDGRSSSPVPSPGSWNVDRGRSRLRKPSNPFSEDNLRRKGYHSLLSSFGKVFHVEKRWKLIRELGSGAYGVVISAADEISGEIVAIKLVTRVFDKIQLAKRALREITLLRHFASHENITGLIDVDAISPDFNEIYIFMEPMEADLHQIIKSGQTLTNEHVQYFLYQILRGMKYVHSASVIHRDLKPGNLLVNADCELKICDFGLSRGFETKPDENTSHLTEYVATRWYRAPEIMLAFRRYTTASALAYQFSRHQNPKIAILITSLVDVWSIGCILAELLLGKPLFKGKDYVDQLNKVLDVLGTTVACLSAVVPMNNPGTPDENVIKKIGSEKAQAYVRSLPRKRRIPFKKILPAADLQALNLLAKMLAFDPGDRITVLEALEHPWLAAYHDISDEPECPTTFEKWRKIEELQTLDEFREALWNEIEDYRREVRGMNLDLSGSLIRKSRTRTGSESLPNVKDEQESVKVSERDVVVEDTTSQTVVPSDESTEVDKQEVAEGEVKPASPESQQVATATATATDPVVTYARRSSILQPSRRGSSYMSPSPSSHVPTLTEGPIHVEHGSIGPGSVAFPSQGYVVPARSRTASTVGGEYTRKLLRTLSTVSIHESAEGLAGGLAEIAPIGKYIMDRRETEADAPPSEMPREFGIEEASEGEEDNEDESFGETGSRKERKESKFHI